jgi:hypothetical protein
LAQARSLREIAGGLKSCEGKLKHLGLEREPKRCTLSYANAHRPWELLQRLFYDLLKQCQEISPQKKSRFKNRLLSLDSTTVELCASMFDWVHWRRTKGAVKLHLLLDHDGYLPVFGHVPEGKVGDVKVAQTLISQREVSWRWTVAIPITSSMPAGRGKGLLCHPPQSQRRCPPGGVAPAAQGL